MGLAPEARMTRPPMKKAKTAVRRGGMIPAARWNAMSLPAEVVGSPRSGGGVGGVTVMRRSCDFLSLPAEHLHADLLLRHAVRVLGHDPALVDDQDAVGEGEDLLELERDEENRPPLVALLHEAAVEVLDRADVKSSRGLRRDQHLRVAIDLPGDDEL